jgi:hypothetical protein
MHGLASYSYRMEKNHFDNYIVFILDFIYLFLFINTIDKGPLGHLKVDTVKYKETNIQLRIIKG